MTNVISMFKRHRTKRSRLEDLVAPHLDSLYRQAYRYCGNEHDAEDLMQELMLDTHQREEQLRDAPVPAAWLSRTLYHRFVDRYRKNKHYNNQLNVDDHLLELSSDSDHEESYLHVQLLRAMEQLSPEQRMSISLHDIEGQTLPEISKALDIPVGTLKSHLHRGRKILKNCLSLQPSSDAVR